MAEGTRRVSELPAASSQDGSETLSEVQSGSSKRVTVAQLIASAAKVSVNTQVGTTYTLQSSDNGKVVTLDNGGSITLTCPAGLGAAFSCVIMQLGVGQVGVIASGGATVNSYIGLVHLAGRYASGNIIAPTANNFILSGQTA